MSIYRSIQVSFWEDVFTLKLTPEEKYFYLYLLTNPKTTQCGIYEIPKKIMEVQTGYNQETVEKLIKKFIEYEKILYSPETNELMVQNWFKYNCTKSPSVHACIERELNQVQNKDFIEKYLALCKAFEYISDYSIDTVGTQCIHGVNRVSIEWVESGGKNKKKKKNKKNNNNKTHMCEFDELWKNYPRKVEKNGAYNQYQIRIKEGFTHDQLLKATKNYALECKNKNTEERYIKLAKTFFGHTTPFEEYIDKFPPPSHPTLGDLTLPPGEF